MIKYLGSKRTLIPRILDLVDRLEDVETACDAFTGTTRVAQALKSRGIHVTANDTARYSHTLAQCFIEADATQIDTAYLQEAIRELNQLAGIDGYITKTFCEDARFFQPKNGRRIDAIRPMIDQLARNPIEHAVLLTSLMLAADRVDSTTGVQMAYLKQWAERSFNDLELRMPELLNGSGAAICGDANTHFVTQKPRYDLVYLDPPYNQHAYHGNYHIWETLTRNDSPEAYGIARKRSDVRERKSAYNSKRSALASFTDLINAIDAKYILVSFNAEGHIKTEEITAMLEERAEVGVIPVKFRRYIGAKIGIHSPTGERVGRAGAEHTTEYLFLAGPNAQAITNAQIQVAQPQ